MPGVEFFKRDGVMPFKIVYLVSLLFVFPTGKFYEVRCVVKIIGIPFNNAEGTLVKKAKEVFVNVIDVRFETAGVIHFTHQRKTFMQGVLNIVFP